jgi:dTDP-4-dehydrorhamnose 3,5-epimerase-like enzyme
MNMFFYESFSQKVFEQATGLKRDFVQDNHSKSQKGGVARFTLSTNSYDPR